VVLITADGRSAPDDVKRFLDFGVPHDVYCVARSYKVYPGKMDHWANVDAEQGIWWAENLPKDKIHEHTLRHTLGWVRGYDVDWDVVGSIYEMDEVIWHGSTSLFAVYTALAMGYQILVLAGCPLDNLGHWYDPPEIRGPRWNGETYQAWLDFKDADQGKTTRSLSGYTRIMIGKEPTLEWINDTEHSSDKDHREGFQAVAADRSGQQTPA
jgi:hypothetical protein